VRSALLQNDQQVIIGYIREEVMSIMEEVVDQAPERPRTRIIINLEDNGAITPEFEGVSPYMAPTILRKVAAMIEAELTRV
jgi:hypothetical protein